MLNSITSQIKKLDRELDGCKERLNALKVNQTKSATNKCLQSKGVKLRRSRSAMNRKKIVDEEFEATCNRHNKVQKKFSEKCKKKADLDSPNKKKSQKIKQRSRSVSCGRECDCDCVSENNYFHNDLVSQKKEEHPGRKNSWANILKEQNKHNLKRGLNENKKGLSENCNVISPKSIYLQNRGIQCSESSFIPSKTVSGVTGFTAYNPTRTLQFLMSEIRENLKHKREDKVLNIINDMEDTVFRLKSNHESLFSADQKHHSNNLYREQPMNNHMYANQEINRVFEEGFARLETTCKTLEITCTRLKEENKQLQMELQKKDASIATLEKKDTENLEKINTLNKHLYIYNQRGEQYNTTIEELTKILNQVEQENKCLEPLKDINFRLDSKVTEINKEKERYFYENQILKLENEKLKILLEIKEKQLYNYKDVFYGLEDRVRNDVRILQDRCASDNSDPDSSAPLCSSPNTSGSLMAPAYGSWRGISRVSSHAESSQPQTHHPIPYDNPHPGMPVARHREIPKHQKGSMRDSDSSYNDPVHISPRLDVQQPRNPLNGLDGIRGQIKMMFSDPCSQKKVSSSNHNLPLWTNLNSVRTSATSYNTTK